MTLIMPPVGQALSALRRADGRAESLLVRKLAQFTDLDAAEKQALARLSTRLRAFRAHADIVREGEPLRVLRVLLDGWACRYKRLEDGRRQIVCFFVPGDICDIARPRCPPRIARSPP